MFGQLCRFLLIGLLGLAATDLRANGGPIDFAAIERTGNVQLTENAQVTLLAEDLTITIEPDYVQVIAVYQLRSEKDYRRLEYGFPIDVGAHYEDGVIRWEERFVDDFHWALDGEALDHRQHQDRTPFAYRREENGETVEVPFRRFWHLGKLSLTAGETHTLSVSYRVKPQYVDWITSKDVFPYYEPRDFVYDLRPAGYWNSASLERFSITVDVGEALRCGRVVWLKGMDQLKRSSRNEYSWEASNVALPEVVLDLRYEIGGCPLSRLMDEGRLPSTQIAGLKASSQLEGDYQLENLLDRDLSTAWVEGVDGPGKGQWLQIELKPGTRLRALMLLNGYLKNESVYLANGRLKRVRVEYEMRFNAEDEWRTETAEAQFTDLPFRALTGYNYGVQAEPVLEFGDYGPLVRRVRIYIEDTYPGTKYEDTCLSELILIGGT